MKSPVEPHIFFLDNTFPQSTFFPVSTSYILNPKKEKSLENVFLKGSALQYIFCPHVSAPARFRWSDSRRLPMLQEPNSSTL